MHDKSAKTSSAASAAVDLRTSVDQDWELVRDLIQKSEDLEATDPETGNAVQVPPDVPPVDTPEPARRKLALPRLKRPGPRIQRMLLGAVLIAAAIIRPGLVLGLTFLLFFCVVIACAMLGPERLAPMAARFHQRLSTRAPKRAEQFLNVLGIVLRFLPPRWGYSFEMIEVATSEKPQNDIALQRLNRMAAER